MRRAWLVAGVLAALCASAHAARAGDEAAVLSAQDARIAATIAADIASLEAMLTDDLSYTHSNAVVETRADFLEGLRTGRYRYRSVSFEERRVRPYGDSAVVAGTCRVQVTTGGREIEVRLRFTELYVKQGGAWKMALWQSTRVVDPAP